MSLKTVSLGTSTAAARGIIASAALTGTPITLTLTAGHRQKNGARLAIAGETQMGTFGEWSVSNVAATSCSLDGSTGSAVTSGTMVIAALMDRTPFIAKHSAVAVVGTCGGTAATDGIGTVVIEKADSFVSTGFQYDNSSGVATSGFKDALQSGEIAIPAFNDFGALMVEVTLARYMTMRVSAWTSGTFFANLLA